MHQYDPPDLQQAFAAEAAAKQTTQSSSSTPSPRPKSVQDQQVADAQSQGLLVDVVVPAAHVSPNEKDKTRVVVECDINLLDPFARWSGFASPGCGDSIKSNETFVFGGGQENKEEEEEEEDPPSVYYEDCASGSDDDDDDLL